MGDLDRANQSITDFVPTQFVIDRILSRRKPWWADDHERWHHDNMLDMVEAGKGDRGFDVETLMESILEQGFLPPEPTYRADPSFEVSGEGISQYEGNHRAAALARLGAPYIPYTGYFRNIRMDSPHPLPLGEEFTADVLDNNNQYSIGGYLGMKGRLPLPASYVYGREMVPGMGRLLPVDSQGNPLDMHGHIHEVSPEHQKWYDSQRYVVVHDE